jgi:CheY-like chemotaxis protein
LQKVQKSSQRASDLVSKMLIFAREKTITAEHPILPSIVVDEVVGIGTMLRSGISATIDISMNNALTDASPLILIDPSELHQIMTNLIVNARDAIEEAQLDRPGGGKIEVGLYVDSIKESDNVYCNVCSHPLRGDYVVISVKDTGTGIKSENLMRLFNPFFTTKDVGKGTGLGLSVVSGILHGADAHIHVLSQLGQGSTFRLFFPAVYPPNTEWVNSTQEMASSEETLNHKNEQPLKICVIDDEQYLCELLEIELTCLGYSVKSFDNSRIAADYLRDNLDEIDAVITDYSMPHLTGLELAIAVLKMRPQLPILICTGYSDKLKSKADLPEGNTFLFRKPFNPKELDKTIKAFFNKSP